MNEKVQPVAKVVRGAVRIAIWEQEGKYGKFYTMSVSKNYKDGEEWKSSNSFAEDEALLLRRLLAMLMMPSEPLRLRIKPKSN